MMQDPNAAAAIDELRKGIAELKRRVAEIEGHPSLSVPPLASVTDDGCTLCGGPHWESQCPNNR